MLSLTNRRVAADTCTKGMSLRGNICTHLKYSMLLIQVTQGFHRHTDMLLALMCIGVNMALSQVAAAGCSALGHYFRPLNCSVHKTVCYSLRFIITIA